MLRGYIDCEHLIILTRKLVRKTCSCILYIATSCNIVVFMTVCIYRYIHTTALYY